MKNLFLAAFLLAACGGEESECLGPVGEFEGIAILSVNNCSNPVYSHGLRTLTVVENSPIRKCGEHILEYEIVGDPITTCKIYYTKSIFTKPTEYLGAMKGEVDCTNVENLGGKCLSFWEVYFEKVSP